MKKLIIVLGLIWLVGTGFGLEVWQAQNNWLDISFLSRSEYNMTMMTELDNSAAFYTNDHLTLWMNHFLLSAGISDYRQRSLWEVEADTSFTVVNTAAGALNLDVTYYPDPKFQVILSGFISKQTNESLRYQELSNPVLQLAILKQFPVHYAFISLRGAYGINLQTSDLIQPNANSKHVGMANNLMENTQYFDVNEQFNTADQHVMVAFSYITTKRKSFPHVPDQMPLLYSPNNTFLVKSSLDYYLDKKQLAGGTEHDTRMGKLNVSATGKFFQRAEVSALLRAADYKYDGYAADVSQYLLQGGMKIYLYDTVETKLLPGVDYRHLEIVNNSADVPVIRLERWITPSFTLTTTFGNTILLTTTVNQDVLYGWSQRNTSTNGYSYIDYKKHDRILNFSAGLTMFY